MKEICTVWTTAHYDYYRYLFQAKLGENTVIISLDFKDDGTVDAYTYTRSTKSFGVFTMDPTADIVDIWTYRIFKKV